MKNLVLAGLAGVFSMTLMAQAYRGGKTVITPEEKLNELYCTGLFKNTHGTILDVTSSISTRGFINILDWLQGRVAGLQIYTSRTGIIYPVIRGNIPGIFVDEIPVTADFLNQLNINDIAIVKIIKTPFYGGFNGGNGAIAIYTLRGEDEEESADGR